MTPDLGLDLKLSTTKFITHLANEPSSVSDDNNSTRIAKLEEHLKNLEDEKRKIEVFKRELPLCMFLLNNVIYGVKVEVEQFRRERPREFMPVLESELQNVGGVRVEDDCQDKVKWMSSAQLWNDNYSEDKNCKKNDHESEVSSFESERKDFGGTFVPFRPFSGNKNSTNEEDTIASPVFCSEIHRPKPIARCQVSSPASSHISNRSQEGLRKARRCWSPELHCRFLAALEQLGGAQVATPKQIRELMKIDGLTNDEVKSHLQKFRLYGRRVGNVSVNRSPVMVVGGLWGVGKDESGSQSGSPQGPLQLASTSHCGDEGQV